MLLSLISFELYTLGLALSVLVLYLLVSLISWYTKPLIIATAPYLAKNCVSLHPFYQTSNTFPTLKIVHYIALVYTSPCCQPSPICLIQSSHIII